LDFGIKEGAEVPGRGLAFEDQDHHFHLIICFHQASFAYSSASCHPYDQVALVHPLVDFDR